MLAVKALREQGIDARSLKGGMQAWSLMWNLAVVDLPGSRARIIQVRRTGKGCLSYIVASGGNATCAACHGTDNFVPNNVFNNGLENPYVDKGIGALTGLARDEGIFKVPSLRNVEVTAPYMHDGRFATLEDVVEFYNSGVTNHPNLSPPLRVPTPPGAPPGPPRRLNLTPEQKAALVAFLKTLTDTTIVTDPKFSDPFNYGN